MQGCCAEGVDPVLAAGSEAGGRGGIPDSGRTHMQPPRGIDLTVCICLVLVGSSCGGDVADSTQSVASTRSADAGMQFGTLVVARDIVLANSAPLRGLKDVPGSTVSTGYRGTRLVDVFFADGVYCLAVGPAPGADEGSQDAWVTAGVGTSTMHERVWDRDVTTCHEALQGIRRLQADVPSSVKILRMLRSLDRSKVRGIGIMVMEHLDRT